MSPTTAAIAACLGVAAPFLRPGATPQQICTKTALGAIVVDAHRLSQQQVFATSVDDPSVDPRRLLPQVVARSSPSLSLLLREITFADVTWDFEGVVSHTLEMELRELEERVVTSFRQSVCVLFTLKGTTADTSAIIWLHYDGDAVTTHSSALRYLLFVVPGRVKVVNGIVELLKRMYEEMPTMKDLSAMYQVWTIQARTATLDNTLDKPSTTSIMQPVRISSKAVEPRGALETKEVQDLEQTTATAPNISKNHIQPASPVDLDGSDADKTTLHYRVQPVPPRPHDQMLSIFEFRRDPRSDWQQVSSSADKLSPASPEQGNTVAQDEISSSRLHRNYTAASSMDHAKLQKLHLHGCNTSEHYRSLDSAVIRTRIRPGAAIADAIPRSPTNQDPNNADVTNIMHSRSQFPVVPGNTAKTSIFQFPAEPNVEGDKQAQLRRQSHEPSGEIHRVASVQYETNALIPERVDDVAAASEVEDVSPLPSVNDTTQPDHTKDLRTPPKKRSARDHYRNKLGPRVWWELEYQASKILGEENPSDRYVTKNSFSRQTKRDARVELCPAQHVQSTLTGQNRSPSLPLHTKAERNIIEESAREIPILHTIDPYSVAIGPMQVKAFMKMAESSNKTNTTISQRSPADCANGCFAATARSTRQVNDSSDIEAGMPSVETVRVLEKSLAPQGISTSNQPSPRIVPVPTSDENVRMNLASSVPTIIHSKKPSQNLIHEVGLTAGTKYDRLHQETVNTRHHSIPSKTSPSSARSSIAERESGEFSAPDFDIVPINTTSRFQRRTDRSDSNADDDVLLGTIRLASEPDTRLQTVEIVRDFMSNQPFNLLGRVPIRRRKDLVVSRQDHRVLIDRVDDDDESDQQIPHQSDKSPLEPSISIPKGQATDKQQSTNRTNKADPSSEDTFPSKATSPHRSVAAFVGIADDSAPAKERQDRLAVLRQKKLQQLQKAREDATLAKARKGNTAMDVPMARNGSEVSKISPPIATTRATTVAMDDEPAVVSLPSQTFSLHAGVRRPSNRQLIQNAIEFTLLAGSSLEKERHAAVAALMQSSCDNFVVLLKSAKELKFRGLYEHHVDRGQVVRLYSLPKAMAPPVLSPEIISQFFRYNSGKKEFAAVDARSFTAKTDACALTDQLVFRSKKPSSRLVM